MHLGGGTTDRLLRRLTSETLGSLRHEAGTHPLCPCIASTRYRAELIPARCSEPQNTVYSAQSGYDVIDAGSDVVSMAEMASINVFNGPSEASSLCSRNSNALLQVYRSTLE